MTSCRDCSKSTPSSARSCPHCGILNPVVQWVAFPDGSHLTKRLAPDPVAAAAALSGRPAPMRPVPAPVITRAHQPARPTAAAVAASGPDVDAIRACSTAFFWLAGLHVVLGLVFLSTLGAAVLLEGGIMAGLSFWLRRYNSRVAAVLLVLYALLTIYGKVMVMMEGGGMRVGWIWLWVAVTGAALKAAAAAFRLHSQPQSAPALA